MRSPVQLLSFFNCPPEIALGVVRVLAAVAKSLVRCKLFLAVVCDKVVLDIDKLAVGIYPVC